MSSIMAAGMLVSCRGAARASLRARAAPRAAGAAARRARSTQAWEDEQARLAAVPAVVSPAPWAATAAWRPGPTMVDDVSNGAAVAAHGSIYLFGGLVEGLPVNEMRIFDLERQIFRSGPNLAQKRSICVAVQLDADRALVVGGFDGQARLKTTELLHLRNWKLSPGPTNTQVARTSAAIVKLDANRVLIAGGHSARAALATTDVLNIDTLTFDAGPKMDSPRDGCVAVALDAHRVLVVGGCTSSARLKSTEILDLRTRCFAPGPPMTAGRFQASAVQVDENHVLILGGQGSSFDALRTTELLDLATMKFSPGPPMLQGRFGCAAVRVQVDGRPQIVVIGGRGPQGLRTTEVLDVQ
ncbi:hypothetical protein M885DRAFT_536311 [Pelagophyceae sp. CCMP2097]|nr:hypothetical protein M885DRAFT_536311 [Pelagophyceae sp. CCMP2097]